ncbi:MAG: YgiQ family radical SAM protein, partial [Clostridiales bacterium]
MSFLPISKSDLENMGWNYLDFVLISGDAYIDHPSFGHSIISRVLEKEGYRVGIIAQPDWKNATSIKILGKPKLGFLITSGVIDSMVNHYTVNKKLRSNDVYSPGGKTGCRPDRAIIVYTNLVRQIYKDIPIIIGGIEASLRRFSHYDYWDNKIRRSVLLDSKADVLVYGMGEKPVKEIAERLSNGEKINNIDNIRGTVVNKSFSQLNNNFKEYLLQSNKSNDVLIVHSHEEIVKSKEKYGKSFLIQSREQDYFGKVIIQKCYDRYIIQNPPIKPLNISQMDNIYSLPYERTYHPVYEKFGGVPAIKEVEFSITSHRGCFGGCSFCALNFHQGRIIQKRSKASIVTEAEKIIWSENFKGYIHDIGGPTANFRNRSCLKQDKNGICKDKQCLYPKLCDNLVIDHKEYLDILRTVRNLNKVKKVFIRSGIRYDYLIADKNKTFFNELCKHHVSGQLKVAPEHIANKVLHQMGKPKREVYDKFVDEFFKINKKLDKEQYLVPYLISSHPGSDMKSAIKMAEYLKKIRYNPEQVQDFYPTPGTLSTCIFYTEIDPRTNKKVYVAKNKDEKRIQRALLQFRKTANFRLIYNALISENREDLIGYE